METFALLPVEERKTYFSETAAKIGIKPEHVEKDFWVCWTLGQLFGLPEIGNHLTFKGGTSLSKAYRIIQRFSEDIDVSISREYLGFGGSNDPEKAPSSKKRKARLSELKQACGKFITQRLHAELQRRMSGQLTSEEFVLSVDEQDQDGQTLQFRYPVCWPDIVGGYIGRFVKIEMGARSDPWPTEQLSVSPYVAEYFPARFKTGGRLIQVLAKERTFWEKAALLHEENCRPTDKPVRVRLSRHYSDLARMIEKGIGDMALAKMDLFGRVVEHRSVFFACTWVDYNLMKPGSMRILPPHRRLAEWKADYEQMREMFFQTPPAFDAVLESVAAFERRLNGN